MTPVDQDRFGSPRGNCTEAAFASLLGVPLSSVPDLAATDEPWQLVLDAWLRAHHGSRLLCCDAFFDWMPDVLHLMSGTSPRGLRHMVVARGGDMIHDPHPDRTGIGPAERFYFVVPDR